MADLDKLTDELTSKAAVAATRNAAKRAVEDLLSTDAERAERAASSKSRRNKLIIYGVIGSLLVVGLIGMVLSYWYWFMLLGVVGLAALYVWRKLSKRAVEKKARVEEPIEAPATKQIADADDDADARARAQALREERARAEAEGEEQQIEDELAAIKARIRK